jgi:hypothetical protein
MELRLYCSLAGLVGPEGRFTSLAEALPALVDAGYAGAVAPLSLAESIPDFRSQLGERGLDYIAIVATEGSSVAEHVEALEDGLAAAEFHRPQLVVVHGGSDGFADAQAAEFLEVATSLAEDASFVVAHGTHRRRILGTPSMTDRMLVRFAELPLSIDFAYWVWATGRLLDDDLEVVRRAAEQAVHIDARVGHEGGPQVPDPRAPEWAAHLDAHERWWSMVWDAQQARGDATTSLTPGWRDSWEVMTWLGERQRARFAQR